MCLNRYVPQQEALGLHGCLAAQKRHVMCIGLAKTVYINKYTVYINKYIPYIYTHRARPYVW